jgi:hypothetical protein
MKLGRQILSGQVDDVSKSWKVQSRPVQFYRNFVPTFRVSLCFIVAHFMNFPISQGDAFLRREDFLFDHKMVPTNRSSIVVRLCQ